jgi:hypothetical protein
VAVGMSSVFMLDGQQPYKQAEAEAGT